MSKNLEFGFSTKSAELGCEVMDWLNENRIEHTISVVDMSAKRKEFVFDVKCSRVNASKVTRYFRELLMEV